jgi:hypothetical protein
MPERSAGGGNGLDGVVFSDAAILTRSSLDGRTNAAKVFDKLVADIEAGRLSSRISLLVSDAVDVP